MQPGSLFQQKWQHSKNICVDSSGSETHNCTAVIIDYMGMEPTSDATAIMSPSQSTMTEARNGHTSEDARTLWRSVIGYTMAGATGVSLTLDILVIRNFKYVREKQQSVLFWAFLLSTIISTVLMCIFEAPVLPNSIENFLYVLAHSVCSTLQWPLYFFAASYVTGSTINIIMSSSSVFMLLSQ